MATDVVGYSRLMEEDEAGTFATLKAHRKEVIEGLIDGRHGRVVKLMGDGALVEFPSVVEAVQCAIDIQTGLEARNAELPPDRRVELRIGVNLGDVIIDGHDIYGDGVNVAARLQQLAPPGGIYSSDLVRQSVEGKLDVTFADFGAREVKNLARPVHVFQIVPGAVTAGAGRVKAIPQQHQGRRSALVLGLLILLILSGVLAWTMLGSAPPNTSVAGCTDHLGLPVAPEKCAEIGK